MTFDVRSLSEPFPANAIHWRAQTMNKEGTSAMALAYIDARDVMARLDQVCGPENWQDSYAETPKGRLICTLALRIGGEWITKSDGAGDTDVEGDKGAISDALKRAAVKWGIGRYLYDMPVTWADCESYDANGKRRWSRWTASGLRKLEAVSGRAPASRDSGQGEPQTLETTQRMLAAIDGMTSLRALYEWKALNGDVVNASPDKPKIAARFRDHEQYLQQKEAV